MSLVASVRRFSVLMVGILCSFVAATCSLQAVLAQEAAAAADAEAAAAAAAAQPVDLTIPSGSPAELVAFIKKLAAAEPVGTTDDEQIAYAKRVLNTIIEAADRIVAAKPEIDVTVLGLQYRWTALQGLSQLRDEAAGAKYKEALDAAMADARPEVATFGWQFYLRDNLMQWPLLDAESKDALAKKIVDRVKAKAPTSLEVSIVALVAGNLDHVDTPFVAKLLTDTVPVFQKSDADDVKSAFEEASLEGMLRRYELLGKPMELTGELLGGGEIDWASYRGKVVLVDFSATWCPPCIEEAPNVLAMYNQYKDKGFDVVAISLDDTPEAAAKYVKDNGIEWKTMFPAKEEDRNFNHPMVKHYGVTGIPTAILLDKEGKAVNLDARDAVLREELARLLGEPAGSTPAAGAAAATPAPQPAG
jgi:thiol-disulfide isomerase/thioredoxin